MVDVATGCERSDGTRQFRLGKSYDLGQRVGYCADCGTWDSHGQFCSACGYDFRPAAEVVTTEPVAGY